MRFEVILFMSVNTAVTSNVGYISVSCNQVG